MKLIALKPKGQIQEMKLNLIKSKKCWKNIYF